MRVYVRYYKRFDADLYSLWVRGISLSPILEDALYAYAHREPYKLLIPQSFKCDLNAQRYNQRMDESEYIVKAMVISDPESVKLLKRVKRGYRNSFCKMLLREAMVHQMLGAFFTDDDDIEYEQEKLDDVDISAIPGLEVYHGLEAENDEDGEKGSRKTSGRRTKRPRSMAVPHEDPEDAKGLDDELDEEPASMSVPAAEEPVRPVFRHVATASAIQEAEPEPVNGTEQEAENVDQDLFNVFKSMMKED